MIELIQSDTDRKQGALPPLYYKDSVKHFLDKVIEKRKYRKDFQIAEKKELAKIGHSELKSLTRISKIRPEELHKNTDVMDFLRKKLTTGI